MHQEEKDILFLLALLSFGAVLASGLAAFLQWIVALPLTIAVLLLLILFLFQNRPGGVHLSENLEKIAFIVVLISIIFSFIYLYKPL